MHLFADIIRSNLFLSIGRFLLFIGRYLSWKRLLPTNFYKKTSKLIKESKIEAKTYQEFCFFSSLHATLYPCPETPQERREIAIGVMTRIEDLQTVKSKTLG